MAPTIPKTSGAGSATRAPRKKKVTGSEPTRRSTRTVTPREVFSATGITKAPAKHHKRNPTVADKVVGVAKKIKGAVTKKPAVKAAGTKKIKGTDGKGSKK